MENFSLRYRKNLPPALDDLSITIKVLIFHFGALLISIGWRKDRYLRKNWLWKVDFCLVTFPPCRSGRKVELYYRRGWLQRDRSTWPSVSSWVPNRFLTPFLERSWRLFRKKRRCFPPPFERTWTPSENTRMRTFGERSSYLIWRDLQIHWRKDWITKLLKVVETWVRGRGS